MTEVPAPDGLSEPASGMGACALLISQLPPAAAAFFFATKLGDLDALVATFVDNAPVNDQLRDNRGKEATTSWAARDVIGERLTLGVHHK
ncbi:MAG: hypothetical protein WDN46_16480 [Methylocella sp.]